MSATRLPAACLAACLLILFTALLTACRRESPTQFKRTNGAGSQRQVSDELFGNALANLNQLETFGPNQILEQTYERLNDWVAGKQPKVEWRRAEILDTLPEPLAETVSLQQLTGMTFDLRDAQYLRRCVWMRDVAQHVAGGAEHDLVAAERLFDWVVRNIQTEPEPPIDTLQPINYLPDEALLFGHGRVADKSWIFILLARQLHLDAMMLAVPDAGSTGGVREWLPAVFLNGDFYLFDMALGAPVPGPDGQGVATLAQLRQQPELLQHLETADFPYRFKAEQLDKVVALIVASDQAFSQRMQAVEANLAGDERLLLSMHTEELIEQLKQSDQLEDVRLWERPFRIAAERAAPIAPSSKQAIEQQMRPFELEVANLSVNPLWAGRVLQFRGDFDGKESARGELLAARETVQVYDRREFEELDDQDKELRPVLRLIATYWLGHISFETEQYNSAVEFFGPQLVRAFLGIQPSRGDALYDDLLRSIQAAASYNFGRSFEELGNIPQAVVFYERDYSANRPASLLRKKRLLDNLDEAERTEVLQQAAEIQQLLEAQNQ